MHSHAGNAGLETRALVAFSPIAKSVEAGHIALQLIAENARGEFSPRKK
jgi:hypothetical protein